MQITRRNQLQRNSLHCRLTKETAPLENSEYSEEPVAKKLISVQTAKPNAPMYLAIAVAMVEAMMFGLDQGNFGNVRHMKASRNIGVKANLETKMANFLIFRGRDAVRSFNIPALNRSHALGVPTPIWHFVFFCMPFHSLQPWLCANDG